MNSLNCSTECKRYVSVCHWQTVKLYRRRQTLTEKDCDVQTTWSVPIMALQKLEAAISNTEGLRCSRENSSQTQAYTASCKDTVLMRSQQNCSKQERQYWTECTEYVWRAGKLASGQRNNASSSDSWRARRNIVFCQVRNTRFHRFLVGQISQNLNTTRRSVSRWKLSGQNLKNFTARGRFSPKMQKKISKIFNVLRLQAAITPQWLEIAENSQPK